MSPPFSRGNFCRRGSAPCDAAASRVGRAPPHRLVESWIIRVPPGLRCGRVAMPRARSLARGRELGLELGHVRVDHLRGELLEGDLGNLFVYKIGYFVGSGDLVSVAIF